MLRIERLTPIGRVAGGVAQELRNPLNGICLSAYFLQNSKNAAPEESAEHLQRIEQQGAIPSRVISARSEFVRMPLPQLERISILDGLKRSVPSDSWPENV